MARCPALVLVGGGCASDLQLRAELPDRRDRHETIMSCLVVLVCAVSGSSVAVQGPGRVAPGARPPRLRQDGPVPLPRRRSSSVSRPRIGRQCVAPVGQLVREEAVEVRLSCRAGPTDRSPGPRPRADMREARPSFSPGRPGGRRLSQPLLVWVEPLLEPVEPCGRPPQGDLHEGCVVHHRDHAQRGRDEPWWTLWGPGIVRRPSAP